MLGINRWWVLGFSLIALAACKGGYDSPGNGGGSSPGVLSFSSAAFSGAEGGATVTITVTRTGGSSGAVSAQFSSSNGTATAGSDYTAASGTLNWANGDSASKTFTVAVTDDAAVEAAETVNLALSAASGGASIGTGNAVLTIADNDSTLALSAAAFTIGEAGAAAAITLNRTAGAGASLPAASLSFATSNGSAAAGSDYTATTTVNWAAGDTTAKTVNVPITNDTEVEGAETVNLAVSAATGAVLGAQTTAVLTINDNDVATLGGVAAIGAPLAGATVTLRDSTGATRVATTNSSGQFSLDTTGLTPPFLLRAVSGSTTLFSEGLVAGSSGSLATVNIHPYSNLLMQVYYQGQGLSAATVFNAAGAPSALPSAEVLNNLSSIVADTLQQILVAAGLDTGTFNLITTTLVANGTGFDGVLDDTVFNVNGLDFTVNNGSITQSVDVNVDADGNSTPGDVAFNSTTTDNTSLESSQSSQQTTVAPAGQQSDFDAAVAGVRATFSSLAAEAAQQGANFDASDAMAAIDPAYLDSGDTAQELADDIAGFFNHEVPSGATVTVDEVIVVRFTENGAADTLRAIINVRVTPAQGAPSFFSLGGDGDGSDGIVFRRQANGSFLFFGNQFRFDAKVQVQFSRDYQPSGQQSVVDRLRIQSQMRVPPGTVTAGSVQGPANSLPQCSGGSEAPNQDHNQIHALNQSQLTLDKRSGLFNGNEEFGMPCNFGFPAIASAPPAGTTYSFSITPAGESAVTQSTKLNASTNDTFDILTINGQDRAAFAAAQSNRGAGLAGTTLTLTWNRPATLPVSHVEVSGFVQNANGDGEDVHMSGASLPITATSGQITLPTQVNGQPVTNVNIGVRYEGTHGEKTFANQLFPQ